MDIHTIPLEYLSTIPITTQNAASELTSEFNYESEFASESHLLNTNMITLSTTQSASHLVLPRCQMYERKQPSPARDWCEMFHITTLTFERIYTQTNLKLQWHQWSNLKQITSARLWMVHKHGLASQSPCRSYAITLYEPKSDKHATAAISRRQGPRTNRWGSDIRANLTTKHPCEPQNNKIL